ncbi:MAG: deoxyribose-phosphate aldolase [Phycisphaeraceae bacterium]|nr:deoxyribose-phosphate aldolase [Phycisphaeraceae bacterium]MCW5764294.1 deoxyribose-phosphate aldolase [Phycisphaeraceae bacterium]
MPSVPPSPTVDPVAASQRAASFATRSIKAESKAMALRLAISMTDLTTLEGKDSPEKVRSLCRKAVRPFERDEAELGERVPSVAAVCVYPNLVPVARELLEGTSVKVASVATGFPSGQYPLEVRLRDTKQAIVAGADEIDMVINRGAFLSGRYDEVAEEIGEVAALCEAESGRNGHRGGVHLKVILETGELETLDNVRRASDIAIACIRDGDFIKTSTGKVQPAATMPVCLVMLEAIRDEYLRSGRLIGLKPAGGIRTAKQAWHYLCMVSETVGPLTAPRACPWLSPALFRFGASTLLNDLLRSYVKLRRGSYPADDEFSDA